MGDSRADYFQPCRIPPMRVPPTAPTTRIGAYALVTIASGKLKSSPKRKPVSHPGQGSCTQPMVNPIANRLANAQDELAVVCELHPGDGLAFTEAQPAVGCRMSGG